MTFKWVNQVKSIIFWQNIISRIFLPLQFNRFLRSQRVASCMILPEPTSSAAATALQVSEFISRKWKWETKYSFVRFQFIRLKLTSVVILLSERKFIGVNRYQDLWAWPARGPSRCVSSSGRRPPAAQSAPPRSTMHLGRSRISSPKTADHVH